MYIYFMKYITWKTDNSKTIIGINYFRKTLHHRWLTAFWIYQGSESRLRFWICHGSESTRVLNILRLWICQGYTGFWLCLTLSECLNMPEYAWICLNLSEWLLFYIAPLEYTWNILCRRWLTSAKLSLVDRNSQLF